MGYYIEEIDRHFFIPADHIKPMIKAIHDLANQDDMMGGGEYRGETKVSSHYSWVNMNFIDSDNIREIFKCWRWEVEVDDLTGDIVDISFNGQKLGDDYVLFKTIGRFVKPGSFIEMRGEENEMWRWYFDGETCVEQYPKITWS